MRHRKKAYLTPSARAYVVAAKHRLRLILLERSLRPAALADMTGIPASTISHWLNTERQDFFSLADAVVICDALEIKIRDILPGDNWHQQSPERYMALSFFFEIPLSHAQWLIVVYKGAVKLFGR